MLVIASVFVAFAPSLAGGFVWDDVDLVRDNPWVRSPPSLVELLTTPFMHGLLDGPDVMPVYRWLHRPLTKLLFVLEHRLFGEAPLGYHLVNLGLHASASLLVLNALHRRMRDAGLAHAQVGAAVGALVFALHPSRVESVAWISGVPDPLMVCLLVPALERLATARRGGQLALGAMLVAAAGFAREAAVVAPLLVVLDAYVARRPRAEATAAVFAASLGATAVLGAMVWVGRGEPAPRPLEGGALLPRVLATVGGYTSRALVPSPDTLWPYPLPLDAHGVPVLPERLVPIGIATLALALALSMLVRRGSLPRGALLGLGCAAIALLPASNVSLRSFDTLTTDRYLYLPMACIGGTLGVLVARAYGAGEARRALAQLGCAGLLLAYLLVDLRSSARFESNVTLFANEVAVQPTHLFAYRNLAAALVEAGELDEARRVAFRGARHARAQGHPEDELRFVTHHAALALAETSEADHARLHGLRAFLEALRTDEPLVLRDGAVTYASNASPAVRREVCEDARLCLLALARARVATQELEGSLPLLDALLARSPRDADAWALRAIVEARLGGFDQARATLARAERATGGSERLRPATQAIRAAELAARRPMPTPDAAAIRDAEVALLLGSPEQARRALAPLWLAPRTEARAFLVLAQAEVYDDRLDAAEEALSRGRGYHPDDEALAEAARRLQELRAAQAPAALP